MLDVTRSRRSQLSVVTKEANDAERIQHVILVQCAHRQCLARKQMEKARHFWSNLKSNVLMHGPALPLNKNVVLAMGVARWGYYAGYSISLEVANNTIETRTITRFLSAMPRCPNSHENIVPTDFKCCC